ncbi:MAG: phosphotransferase [Acidimicrobiales bacterium]
MGSGRRRSRALAIPQAPDELTAAWFTTALAPHASGASVRDVRTDIIGTDVGFAGEVYRCHLDWIDDDRCDAPASVIVKVPSQRPENRATVEAVNAYEREILVYRHLGTDLGLSMPAHLYSDFTPNPAPWFEPVMRFLFARLPMGALAWLVGRALSFAGRSTRRYILVLEDVADARPPCQLDGGSIDDARAALTALAQFHAANWRRSDRLATHRFIAASNELPRLRQATYRRNRDEFLATFEHTLTPAVVERLDRVQDRLPEHLDHLTSDPWTILHGDYRLDNLLFRPDGSLVVIDPQLIAWGRPALDVTYFLSTALTPDNAGYEADLLRHYHEELVRAGVDDHPLPMLLDDVALAKDVLGHALVAYVGLLDTHTAQSELAFTDVVTERVLGWLAA